MHTESQPTPTAPATTPSLLDAVWRWLGPAAPAPHAAPRTPDEAQEILARDWDACERQAIRLGCWGW